MRPRDVIKSIDKSYWHRLPKFLETCIDPAILDVIKGLVALPFVAKTHWSCAGYGPFPVNYCSTGIGGAWKTTINKPLINPTHGSAYFVVEYKTFPKEFHKDLQRCGISEPYHFATDSRTYRACGLKTVLSLEETKTYWDNVRKAINKHGSF